jgi:hypothetical protein
MLDLTPREPYSVHQSPRFAEQLVGEYEMPEGQEARVFMLSALTRYYRMVVDLGMLEHTGDWDWRITVTLNDGTIVGTHPWNDDTDTDTWSDEIMLPYKTEPGDYTDHFARWTSLQVEENTFTEGGILYETTVTLPIEDIKTVHFSYDT